MGIEINFDLASFGQELSALADQGPLAIGWFLFTHGGWIVAIIAMVVGFYHAWLDMRQDQYAARWKFTLLAIDIPKNNEQTPKAVENVFLALSGARTAVNLVDKYWGGKIQESFSFELVSLEGYIQFIVRTPSHFRDLVEAAVYAQYPDAEITEIEDYTAAYKGMKFPNEKYDLWGTELVLTKDYPYPLRTYPEFEHQMTQTFIDPMASILEILSRLGPGEQIWIQLVTTPIEADWGEKAKKVVKTMVGETYKAAHGGFNPLAPLDILTSAVGEIGKELGVNLGGGGEHAAKEADNFKMFKITPGDRALLERIQEKLAKPPIKTKLRVIYLADKAVFDKGRGVAGLMSTFQQFSSVSGNGLKPGKNSKTAANYFQVKKRVAKRQHNILRYFISRRTTRGDHFMLLNPEELATLWHFPVMTVKAAALEKIQSKKVAPPSRLPYEIRKMPTKVAGHLPAVSSMAPIHQAGFDSAERDSNPVTGQGPVVYPAIFIPDKSPTGGQLADAHPSAPRPAATPPSNLPTL